MIIPGREQQATPVPAKPHHLLLALGTDGDGFLSGSRFDFVDGLNVLIGGQGSGKTTVLEYIRYLCGRQPYRPLDDEQVMENLKLGTISASLQMKHGGVYGAKRAWGDERTALVDPQGEAADVEVQELFPIDYFAHHEILAIAKNPAAQRELLDRFKPEEMREFGVAITAELRALKENAEALMRLAETETNLRAEIADVKVLEEKLKLLEPSKAGRVEGLGQAQVAKGIRAQERAAFDGTADAFAQTKREAAAFETSATRRLGNIVSEAVLSGPNRQVMGTLAAHIAKGRLAIQKAMSELNEAFETLGRDVQKDLNAIVMTHAEQDEGYRQLQMKSQEETGRTKDREDLQKQLATALQAKSRQDALELERRAVRERRRELLTRLLQIRHARAKLRDQIALDLTAQLAPRIKVHIKKNADKEAYAKALTEALHKSGVMIKAVVEKIADKVTPMELASLVVRGDAKRLAEDATLNVEQAEKVIFKLMMDGVIYALETIEFSDVPCIELLDGKTYKNSTKVSAGQRCTSILPIILLQSDRPLFIDQPEDEMEGEYLVEVIVATLRFVKTRRQIIVATHNPNIVVLGDAERVIVLRSEGDTSKIEAFGTVEETKEHVQNLEGGLAAFLERKRRYGV